MRKALDRGVACLAVLASLILVSSLAADDAGRRGPALTSDRELARIAEHTPGFGGLFYDAEGIANVYLKDLRMAPQFQKAGGPPVRIHRGDYDFRDLVTYKQRLTDLMALPGVVMLDADEGRNRVRVGVEREAGTAAIDQVSAALSSFGVPKRAVIVEAVDPIFQLATVRDRVRPVPAGVQIAFGGFVCSGGFNATRAGVAGLVTASHCTNTQGGVEGTVLYQNTNTSSNRIGVETADPTYFTGSPCPSGRRCRYSDSAFYRYDSSSLRELARIARTTGVGSLTISTTAPRFTITGTANFPSQGQTLNKVGRTTGWSRGSVSFTCTNINVSGTNITQLCQDGVNATVAGGDSGSDVFSGSTSSSNTNATLYGVLWGGSSAGNLFIFSAWENVTDELGSMTVR